VAVRDTIAICIVILNMSSLGAMGLESHVREAIKTLRSARLVVLA